MYVSIFCLNDDARNSRRSRKGTRDMIIFMVWCIYRKRLEASSALLAELYDVVLGADRFYVLEFDLGVRDVQTQIIYRSIGANESFLELTRAQLATIAEDFEQTEYDCDGVAILRSFQRRVQSLLHELVVEKWHVQIV